MIKFCIISFMIIIYWTLIKYCYVKIWQLTLNATQPTDNGHTLYNIHGCYSNCLTGYTHTSGAILTTTMINSRITSRKRNNKLVSRTSGRSMSGLLPETACINAQNVHVIRTRVCSVACLEHQLFADIHRRIIHPMFFFCVGIQRIVLAVCFFLIITFCAPLSTD